MKSLSKRFSEGFKLYAKIPRRKGSHSCLSLKEALSKTCLDFLDIRMNSSLNDFTQ
jgi:hypothetical protein